MTHTADGPTSCCTLPSGLLYQTEAVRGRCTDIGPTCLETDASDFAIAGVLKQEHDGQWHPVAYYSRKMQPAERNYKIHNKELLAVVACLKQWRHMLAGLPQQLVIYTDHKALKYFKSQHCISGQQACWAVILANYDFVLHYRPGDKGGEPDALTWRSNMQPEGVEKEHNMHQLLPASAFDLAEEYLNLGGSMAAYPVSTQNWMRHNPSAGSHCEPHLIMEQIATGGVLSLIRTFQPLDEELKTLHSQLPFDMKDGLWYKDGQLAVPKITLAGKKGVCTTRAGSHASEHSLSVKHLQYMVMNQCHDSINAGHVGQDATLELACQHYWWPNMASWIADYVASCPVCARYKAPRHKPYGLLQPLSTPKRPWGSITLDFIEGLPTSNGYNSILVIVDRLLKLAILMPTHKTATLKDTVDMMQAQVFKRFGIPEHIVLDCGCQFILAVWKDFAQVHNIKHSLSTAYHPQTDSQTKQVNQVIEQYLHIYCNCKQDNWVDLLPMAEFVYKNTLHSSIGISPFFACYGWNPKMHLDLPKQVGILDPRRHEFAQTNEDLVQYLQEQIQHAQSRAVDQYNCKRPFPVLKRISCRAYRVQLPSSLRVHNVFHVSMLEPRKQSKLQGHSALPPYSTLHNKDLEFEVEAIIGKCCNHRHMEYLVQWQGYPEEASSWEPETAINAPKLIQEHERLEGGTALA
ncbi:related to gag-pol protein [Melanopsichium pennsylvanicum]|uniref:Related to gag-pol protein n=1 Tax=Melanopsichium pennsylvanicum TaxID=63383 RepID=A0AAJ5C8M9_9BASI|nr:related to gag-pol protein [Melanopsichium pennsylvanicum]